jgi:hypothetical protein
MTFYDNQTVEVRKNVEIHDICFLSEAIREVGRLYIHQPNRQHIYDSQ